MQGKGDFVKRSRGRGRRPQNSGSNNHNPNRTFDSNGPEIKIRGSAAHVYEKYLQMARDANSAGDRVMAENYLQHAEHYYRILAAAAAQAQQYQQQNPNAVPQNRPPGSDQQPQTPPLQGAAQSFSLNENETEADEDEDAEAS